ncbi:hypothetical protein ACH4ZX_09535 [Streptomyces sp. NPDC020490]|uniref:hypothetical protein n=1 Tax=Streptomyces sp. NPDC020490 TaxID=3365078 RepID=UPI003799ED0C
MIFDDPYTQWVVEQERLRRRRRRTRLVVGGAVGVVLAAAVAAGLVLYSADAHEVPAAAPSADASGTTASAPPGAAALPSGAPSALPSLLALPVVRPEQAFPERAVRLADGSRYERVELGTTTDCADGMSQELASLATRGQGCLRLSAALFTDAARRSQVTVTVVSFRRPEDAWLVFGTAATDPVTYQVVSLDPPPGSGLPTVPPGSAGVFRRLATVRSVVFANGQWGDGSETREAQLTAETEGLLKYVDDKVAAYEQGRDAGL